MSTQALTFIASYPKSGNTWVRYFLMTYIHNVLPELITQDYIPRLENRQLFETATGKAYTGDNFFGGGDAYFDTLSGIGNIFKTHIPYLKIRSKPFFPQDARYICIYRNPLSVAPSFANHLGVSLDQAVEMMTSDQMTLAADFNASQSWRFPLGSWASHARSWLGAQVPRLDLRYEDLVADPEQHFDSVLRFLGLEPEPDRFRFALDATRFDNLQAMEKRFGFREASTKASGAFFRSGRAKPKKTLFTPAQRRAMRTAMKDAADILKYDI